MQVLAIIIRYEKERKPPKLENGKSLLADNIVYVENPMTSTNKTKQKTIKLDKWVLQVSSKMYIDMQKDNKLAKTPFKKNRVRGLHYLISRLIIKLP